MLFPQTPRAVLRAALITVLILMVSANAIVLLVMPDRVAGIAAFASIPGFALRAIGLGSIVLALLTLRRTTRVMPLLFLVGAAGFPMMAIAVQAQPLIAAGILMTAIVVGCILLDRAWLEAIWAGYRF